MLENSQLSINNSSNSSNMMSLENVIPINPMNPIDSRYTNSNQQLSLDSVESNGSQRPQEKNSTPSSSKYEEIEENDENEENEENDQQETSIVNSDEICLDASISFYSQKTNNNSLEKNTTSKTFNVNLNNKEENEPKRIKTAPVDKANKLEEYKSSQEYINLENAGELANKLLSISTEEKFDIESEEGSEICRNLLKEIENLMISMNISPSNREYRKDFSQAYINLFDEQSICFLTEILDSAQEATEFLVLNDENFYFSSKVTNYGNELFAVFCSLVMLLSDSIKNIKDKIFYENFTEMKSQIRSSLKNFDEKWVRYEEMYINELIEIENKARRYIIQAIKLEKQITQYETRSMVRGKLLINDSVYNEMRKQFIDLLCQLNNIANTEGKGRNDLSIDILLKAEAVLFTISDGKSKGMRNLANSIKESLFSMRKYCKEYELKIEEIDPQLGHNNDLITKLNEFEQKWERGKEYLLSERKFSQLLFFSEMIEIICEKYSRYSIHSLIEDRDPSIFVSIPCILLLKAIDNEDKGTCLEYIPNLYSTNDESGKLFTFINEVKNKLVLKTKDDYYAYNLLEKLVLFNGTKEEEGIEKEVGKLIDEKDIKEFKTSLNNLSLHLQRYKPLEWNVFFELAMNINIK